MRQDREFTRNKNLCHPAVMDIASRSGIENWRLVVDLIKLYPVEVI